VKGTLYATSFCNILNPARFLDSGQPRLKAGADRTDASLEDVSPQLSNPEIPPTRLGAYRFWLGLRLALIL